MLKLLGESYENAAAFRHVQVMMAVGSTARRLIQNGTDQTSVARCGYPFGEKSLA